MTRVKWTPTALPLVLALWAAACGGDDGHGDASVDTGTMDGTTIVDGGRTDSGTPGDAGLDSAVPDAAPPSCTGDCDPREGAPCGDAGVCALVADAPMCAEALGTKAAGATCEAVSDCLPGLACFMRAGGGVCADVCCPSDGVCPGDQHCTGAGILVDGTETEWWSCVGLRTCDVLRPAEACERGEGCYIVSTEGDTDCLRAGAGEAGADCVDQNDCASGYFCAGVTVGTCARICEIGATSGPRACPDGEGNCQAYPYSPEGTGVCTRATSAMMFR